MFQSEPIRKSVYRTTLNTMVILAKHGDPGALEALTRPQPVELTEDDEDESIMAVIDVPEGSYVVTQHGATLIPCSG